jgi:hypothetical protein
MFIQCKVNPNYSVDEKGVVINNQTNKVMSPHAHKDGYRKLVLPIDGKLKHQFVHRLVAQAFLPNPENKPMVNHIDGVRDNNHLSNLEWVTPRQNYDHMAHRMYFDRIKELYYMNRNATLDQFMLLIQQIGYM